MKKNVLIFAGGSGKRMGKTSIPKQFITIRGKPVIVHTLLRFSKHKDINGIVVACRRENISELEALIDEWRIEKIDAIVPGGNCGQLSIYNGLKKCAELYDPEDLILIHDGVRPFISEDLISKNILCATEYGSAVTVAPCIETIVTLDKQEKLSKVIPRSACWTAKAPQTFILKNILFAHEQALSAGLVDFIDSASLMRYFGHKLSVVFGNRRNIKITTPEDFYFSRALFDMEEDLQLKKL